MSRASLLKVGPCKLEEVGSMKLMVPCWFHEACGDGVLEQGKHVEVWSMSIEQSKLVEVWSMSIERSKLVEVGSMIRSRLWR